jgi:magnesium transporter
MVSAERNVELSNKREKLFLYCETLKEFESLKTLSPVEKALKKEKWVVLEIIGKTSPKLIARLQELFGFSDFVSDKLAEPRQRPRLERYESELYMIFNIPKVENKRVQASRVVLVWGNNFLLFISPEELPNTSILKERLVKGKDLVKKMGLGYAVYLYIDFMVDSLFPTLEFFNKALEVLEREIIEKPKKESIQKVYNLKRSFFLLHRIIWAERDIVSMLIKDEVTSIPKKVRVGFQDVYNELYQTLDMVENYREMVFGLFDAYLSNLSYRMNEVMKVLTVFATIFIPLTFITGIYGMNFRYMPEVSWRYGYFFSLGIMGGLVAVMLIFFKKRGWF